MKKFLLLAMAAVMTTGTFASSVSLQRTSRHARPNAEKTYVLPDKKRESRKPGKGNLRDIIQKQTVSPFSAKSTKPMTLSTRGADDGSFYGYLVYSYDWYQYLGLYEITPWEGFNLYFEDPGYYEIGFDLIPYNGWYDNGRLNGVSTYKPDGFYVGDYFSYSIDFETGQLLEFNQYDVYSLEYYFDICTLNPNDGLVYGYLMKFNGDYFDYYWASAPFDDVTNFKIIKEAEYGENVMSLCYKPDEKCFYGITSLYMDFVKIDTDGNQEFLNYAPYYDDGYFYPLQTGLIWDPELEVFLWNAQYYYWDDPDLTSYLYYIDPSYDYYFGVIEEYNNGEQFSFFVTPTGSLNADTPVAPVINSVEFIGDALNGVMKATLPTTFVNENPLPSSLSYTAYINGQSYTTGTGAPGSEVTINYTVSESGEYIFGLSVTANGLESNIASQSVYVGIDIPATPVNVLLSPTMVSWDAVTMGAHNGYIDTSDLSYIVYLNDEEVGTVTTTSYALNLLSEPELAKYSASVVAVSNNLKSAPGKSNTIVAGQPATLPLNYGPTEDEFENMTIVNVDGDNYAYGSAYGSHEGITWELSPYGLFSGGTEYNNAYMNDYIFLPPVELTKGTNNYGLIFQTGIYSKDFPDEYLNVVYATTPTPEGVKGYIMKDYTPEVGLASSKFEEWGQVEELFSVPESGVYYIGFQCISAPAQYGIYVKNILLTTVDNTPMAATDVKAVAATQGVLEATVSFTLPVQTLDGKDLTDTLTAEILVNDKPTEVTVTGAPGSTQTVKVPTEQGNNTIAVVVYNAEMPSAQATVNVYTGVYLPATPENVVLTLNSNMMGGTLTWDKVTEAATAGEYVDPATITYTVVVYTSINPTWQVVAQGITTNSYNIQLTGDAPQAQYAWGVISNNAAGNNGEQAFDTAIMGKAYDVPLMESFGSQGSSMSPWLNWPVNGISTTSVSIREVGNIVNNYDGPTAYALVASNNYGIACNGLLSMPYFSTKNAKDLSFTVNALTGENTSAVKIYANIYGSAQDIVIGTIPAGTNGERTFEEFVFEMPESLLNLDYVQVYFEISFKGVSDVFALESVQISGTVGINDALNGDGIISAGNGQIQLKGFNGEQVVIASLDGKVVYSGVVRDNIVSREVAPGVYVVKAGKKQAKVVVR